MCAATTSCRPAEIEALNPDRILISPGPCTPQEAGVSIDLIRHYREGQGAAGARRSLVSALGTRRWARPLAATWCAQLRLMHGKTSEVDHDGRTIFEGLEPHMVCTRYHSLVVSPEGLPDELEVSARTNDPEGEVIMGLRHRELPIEGVQFASGERSDSRTASRVDRSNGKS